MAPHPHDGHNVTATARATAAPASPASPACPNFDLIHKHGHQDLVQAVTFNSYGDRCATGSVDGRIRVFNRHRDGIWRLCDTWVAHGAEVLELQWLPPTIYPHLLASLGIEGRFKLWAEDASAAPGRRFAAAGRSPSAPKPAFETRSSRSPYRSFSMKHVDSSRHTYLALLAADGRLTVYENEQAENLSDYTQLDEFDVFADGLQEQAAREWNELHPGKDMLAGSRPRRGEEWSFRVRFDPNPEVCYTALRAGVSADALGLVAAAQDTLRVYRTRDVVTASLGVQAAGRQFYLAAEVPLKWHGGLIRDVAWGMGNIRGYDILATACQDGFVRVFHLQTPILGSSSKDWTSAQIKRRQRTDDVLRATGESSSASLSSVAADHPARSGIRAGLDHQHAHHDPRKPGHVHHTLTEVSRLESHRTPVWRVAFDDDGQILASVGDEGKLMCHRQTPQGEWIKSSELGVVRMRMAAA